MDYTVSFATNTDIDDLLKFYFIIYQNTYPLQICTDRQVMTDAINSDECIWYIARDKETNTLIGSTIFELESIHQIGKLTGVAVHPDHRKKDIASELIRRGCEKLLGPEGTIRSIYTTTRTISRGPQIMVLKNGFLPLGIFPNAHKLKDFETLTLMARYRDGVLQKRPPTPPIPEKLAPILTVSNKITGNKSHIIISPKNDLPSYGESLEFELIHAPNYVWKKFNETYTDPYSRFFPFHKPNLLLASKDGSTEIFAFLNKADGYLTVVALNTPLYKLTGRIDSLLHQLRGIGVSYIEVLIGLQHTDSLQALADVQFLPSAIYPAMLEINGKLCDFALMTRTLEPLNFRGMSIEKSFKPYVDQYVSLWKDMCLEALEVFNDYR